MRANGPFNPTEAKIVAHLAPLSRLSDDYLQPSQVTQEGIADAVGVAKNHMPRIMRELIESGIAKARKHRVEGARRKRYCYFLTDDGARAAAAMSVPGVMPRRLDIPHPPAHFIGRNDELRCLQKNARSAGLGTIEGGPGIGKTSLALAFLASAGEPAVKFYWSFKQDRSLRGALSSLSEALPAPAGELLAYLLRIDGIVAPQRVVNLFEDLDEKAFIVLDDCGLCKDGDALLALAKSIAGVPAASVILIGLEGRTQRDLPRWRLELAPLARGDTTDLAERCGHPAPGRAYEMSGGNPGLVALWDGKAAKRGHGATEAMNARERDALALLSLFGRPVHIGETAALGIGYEIVSSLVNEGFMVRGGDFVHPLGDSGPPSKAASKRGHRKIAEAILATWSDSEHGIEACEHYAVSGDTARCISLLLDRGEEFLKSGKAAALERLLSGLAKEGADAPEKARMLTLEGNVHRQRARWPEAIGCFERALPMGKRIPGFEAETLARIGSVNLAKRDYATAKGWYSKALKRLPKRRPDIAARIEDELATLHLRTGELDEAERRSVRAIALAAKSGGAELLGLCRVTMGNMRMLQRRHDEAQEHFESALSGMKDNARMRGTLLNNLAALEYNRGMLDKAVELWGEASDIFRRTGDVRFAMTSVNLSFALWRMGSWDKAVRSMRRASTLAKLANDPVIDAAANTLAGQDALFRGRFGEAVQSYQIVAEIRGARENRGELAQARADLASALVAAGELARAGKVVDMDADWAAAQQASSEASACCLASAKLYLARADTAKAEDMLKASMQRLPTNDVLSKGRLFRLLGAFAARRDDWIVSMRYLEDAKNIFKSLKHAPELALTLHDLAAASEKFGSPDRDARISEAKEAAHALGMPYPSPCSDWKFTR